ncbi:MAG: hypothetical protein KF773_09020 [Deltaproteobacteria bacterium]|nr:hypothetical protein [Deltaproteobacteria bacterium]MCW5801269.1 hypothetical protein [Deltaproteobacteria bacterium]
MRRLSCLVLASLVGAAGCVGSLEGTGPGGDDDQPPPPPPPPQLITVRVVDGTVPQPGVPVVFQKSDDTLVADTVTDADGLASADMPDGGNITVIRTATEGPTRVFTYVGAQVGDKLELGRPTASGTPMLVNVRLPTALQNANVMTPCGQAQGGPTVALTLTGCPEQTVFYASNGNQSFVKVAPVAPDISFLDEAVADNLTTTMRVLNLPPNTQSTMEGQLSMLGYRIFSTGQRNAANPQNVNYPNLGGVDQTTLVRVTMQQSQQMVSFHRKFLNTQGVDVGPTMLPYIGPPTVDPSGVTWVETPAGAATLSPDFVVARLNVTPAGGLTPYVRSFVAPYSGTQLRFTQLPAAHAAYNAAAGDQVVATPGLVKIQGGYDGVRSTLFKHGSVLDAAPMDTSATLSYAGTTAPTF